MPIDWDALLRAIDDPDIPTQAAISELVKTAETAKTPIAPPPEVGFGDFGGFVTNDLHKDEPPKAPPNGGHDQETVVSPPAPPKRSVTRRAKTAEVVKTPDPPARDTSFDSFEDFGTGLQDAVKAAIKLGAEFRIIGDTVEIDGELPERLRAALPLDQLYEHLGAAREDRAAVDFLAGLGVSPLLVTDITAAEAVMGMLTGAPLIGLDFETGPPGARPAPVRLNGNGTVARHQPKPDKAGLDPYVSVIQTAQLYAGGDYAFVFHGAAQRHLLASEWFGRQKYVAHNAGFEFKFAAHRGIELQLQCTMQGVGLLHGVERRARRLDNAAKAVLDLEPPKTLQVSCWSAPRLSNGQLSYAAFDAVLALKLWQQMEPELRQKRRWESYELQRGVIPVVAAMEQRGLGFDRERHAQLVAEWRAESAELEQQIIDLTGAPAPTGRDAVQQWVKDVAGDLLPRWPQTPTGLLKTTAADFARLEDAPTAGLVLRLRAKKTLLANFGDKIAALVNPKTGRLHASYLISGAKSGRFACVDPNLQQQPGSRTSPTFKSVFVAAPGCLLIAGDWKQIELRALAHIARCPEMTAVFEAGGDLHTETALAMTGKRREDLFAEELAALREHAKAVNFGTVYGVTGQGLAELAWKNYRIKMSEAEGEQAIARFFDKYPRVRQWMTESYAQSTRRGRITIGDGRVVEVHWEPDHELSPQQCANLPIQGICADLMLRGLKLAHDRLRDANIDGGIIACVHDELLLEAAESHADQARQILEQTMTEAFEQTFPGAPTTGGVVDIKVGPSWGELKAPEEG